MDDWNAAVLVPMSGDVTSYLGCTFFAAATEVCVLQEILQQSVSTLFILAYRNVRGAVPSH